MKIIKRNGKEVDFDVTKIQNAIRKASKATIDECLSEEDIKEISDYLTFKIGKLHYSPNVEEIQHMVQKQIMAAGKFNIATNYIEYRYKHDLMRTANSTDDVIL